MKPMTAIDVFHGDADGLCSIQQIRLAEPLNERQVVSGGLSQHSLLMSILTAENRDILMLDLPLERNLVSLKQLLKQGCRVRCFDHHISSEQPEHERLELHLDASPETCTSLLVNKHLNGAHQEWAAVGAFGDNMPSEAKKLLQGSGLSENDVEQLQSLAELLNYNAYGDLLNAGHLSVTEMHYNMMAYDNPLDFIKENERLARIGKVMKEDLEHARKLLIVEDQPDGLVYILRPREPVRRVRKVWLGQLGRQYPDKALLIALENHDGSFDASIRAPLNSPSDAWKVAERFGGGGREGAASVKCLPSTEVVNFLDIFWHWCETAYQQQAGRPPQRKTQIVREDRHARFHRSIEDDNRSGVAED